MPKIDESNKFYLKLENDKRTENSVRMLEFINLYNLRRHEVLFQCPLLRAGAREDSGQFDLEVESLEEMADVGIIYNQQRRRELARVREIDREN